MTTNETQSKEWTGDGWRVIARPGQVIYMGPVKPRPFVDHTHWSGWMYCGVDDALGAVRSLESSNPTAATLPALREAIAYAWPESVGTFTERGVTG